jgi:asparagine synthetase B (glutamine-hydrolysing)
MCGIAAIVTAGSSSHAHFVEQARRAVASRGPDHLGERSADDIGNKDVSLTLVAAVLHLRGPVCVAQPAVDAATGDALLWNGEVFSGFSPSLNFRWDTDNDTVAVLRVLTAAAADATDVAGDDRLPRGARIAAALQTLHGPWAFVFHHVSSRSLYFGRDPTGRRSLLQLHSPATTLLCSVAFGSLEAPPDATAADGAESSLGHWVDVEPSGVWCVRLDDVGTTTPAPQLHPWSPTPALSLAPDALLASATVPQSVAAGTMPTVPAPDIASTSCSPLLAQETDVDVVPAPTTPGHLPMLVSLAVDFLRVLCAAVLRRVRCLVPLKNWAAPPVDAPVAVLFSGGVDCMVLALLLGACARITGSNAKRCDKR